MNDMNQQGYSASGPIPEMGLSFGKTLSDMRFIGLVGMVYGVMTCLSLVGAVVGVPIIIAANRFLESIKILQEYRVHGRQGDLSTAFHEMGRSFRLMKIIVLISIGLTVLYFMLIFMFGGLALLSELGSN